MVGAVFVVAVAAAAVSAVAVTTQQLRRWKCHRRTVDAGGVAASCSCLAASIFVQSHIGILSAAFDGFNVRTKY